MPVETTVASEPSATAPTGITAPANPAAMTVEQTSRLLTALGAKHAGPDVIRAHVAAGAPVSRDGMINLVHYVAWLVQEVSSGEE